MKQASRTCFSILAMVSVCWLLTGCNAYTLRGKVVRGSYSDIEVVHESDERLQQPGIAGAEVLVHRDPNKPNRYLVGRTRTNTGGEFTLLLNEFGAGWMEEQWRVQTIHRGNQNADTLMKLPPNQKKWRLLITLAPGTSTPADSEEDDWMRDYEQFR